MAEGCEETESNSSNRNADNAPTMLGTVLPCEAAITASLGVSGGGVMKREFVDAASSILGSSLAAAAHLTASVSLASPTSSMTSPTTLSNITNTPSTTASMTATSITQQQQQHQQRLTPTPKTTAALGPLVCSTTLSSLSSSSSSSSSSSASSNSSTSSSLSSLNSSTTASSSTTAAIATNSNTNKSPSGSPYSSVVAVASLRGISPHSPTVLTSMGPSTPTGHNSNGSCGSISANVTTTTPAVPSNCNSQSPIHVTLNIKTEADYDKEIPPHKIHSPILSTNDLNSNYSSPPPLSDKDCIKELEFYKNLAKAASLASSHHSNNNNNINNNNNNNNNSNNNNNIIINNVNSPQSIHDHHQHYHHLSTEIQESPVSSPQHMQIDTEHVEDEDHKCQIIDDHDHDMTDGSGVEREQRDQAKASALAAAAAAAQAHLNGTMQEMLNLQKLQNLSTFQSEQSIGSNAATAAALASLQGLAAGLTASAAAAALNSPLNLTVTNAGNCNAPTSIASDLLSATHKALSHVTGTGTANGAGAAGGESQHHTGTTSPSSTQINSSTTQATATAQNTLASVLNSAAAAAAAAGAAATASPPPQLQAPPASAQMPQLILASGQLVQGVQGAQLLIPTAQGIAVQTILTIPVSPQINTNEQFLSNFGAFAGFPTSQPQPAATASLLGSTSQLPAPLAALHQPPPPPSLPQLAPAPTNLLKPNLFSSGVQQLLAALHPELFAAAAVNHHHHQQHQQQQQQQQHQHVQQMAAAAAHHHEMHLRASTNERSPPSSPTNSTKAAAAAAAAAAAFHLQTQLHIKPESQTHLHSHHAAAAAAALHHHTQALRHAEGLTSPKLECKPTPHLHGSGIATNENSTTCSPPLSRHQFSSHHRLTSAASSPRPSSRSSNSMTLRERESRDHQTIKMSPSRSSNAGMNLSQMATNEREKEREREREREREERRDRERDRERERGVERIRAASPATLNARSAALSNSSNSHLNTSLSGTCTTTNHSTTVTSTVGTNLSSNDRGFSSPVGAATSSSSGPMFRSHSPHLGHHIPPPHSMLDSPHERDFLGNGLMVGGPSVSGSSSNTANVLNSMNRLSSANGELTITKSHGPPTATATRASSSSPTSPPAGPSTSSSSNPATLLPHHSHHPMHSLKLSPSATSSMQQQQRERERERERDRERLGEQPPQISPNGTEGSAGAHDLLMDSPNEPTINQATTNVVDGIDLDEIKEFAKAFKLRRLSLGLTQTQVGQALSVTEGPAYSQSAICSALAAQMYAAQLSTQQQNMFEKLDITPKSAQKIKPVLERWMKEAEESHWNRFKSGQNHLTDYIGVEPSKKRKRRTSFTPQALELLNAHFERNTHPSGTEITGLAHQLGYEREVIRIWFCNKRQALKNTVRMMSKGMV